jgi:hypothetical protein
MILPYLIINVSEFLCVSLKLIISNILMSIHVHSAYMMSVTPCEIQLHTVGTFVNIACLISVITSPFVIVLESEDGEMKKKICID